MLTCRHLVIFVVFSVLGAALHAEPLIPDGRLEHFEKQVRPLLIAKCYACHSTEKAKSKGGLTLDTKEGWQQGGDTGPAIVPGKPDDSLLIQAVRYEDGTRMPPASHGGKLAAAEIAALEKWVRDGAIDPRTKAAGNSQRLTAEEAKSWWAFQPVRSPALPGNASTHPIDVLLAGPLKDHGLRPLPTADKRTLLRRATYDLTGLPPTPEAVQAFLADTTPDAFRKVIDRLLASPHYGEKWGRHWLDLVRYADSLDDRSYDKDGDILDAWRYRDWVVNAFNRDLPYDQFITHQLAGDILAAQNWDPDKLIATGLYAIGNWGNGDADKEKLHTDIVDDQVDVTSRAFLGVTLACARCHDHKFDPFTTSDYYGLAGFFFSSHILDRFQSKGEGEKLMRIPLQSPAEKAQFEAAQKRLREIEKALAHALRPLTEVRAKLQGNAGLFAWTLPAVDNPSLLINTTERAITLGTLKLEAREVSLHPGPQMAATVIWKSALTGKVTLTVRLRDADPNCGDGIAWELRCGKRSLSQGTMNNGSKADVNELTTDVQAGELVQLTIRPRKEYTCDTTALDFILTADDGRRWNLREDLVGGAAQGHAGVWWLCSGEGDRLVSEQTELAQLEQERQRLMRLAGQRDFAQGLQEGGIPGTSYAGFHDSKIHVRGSYTKLGNIVPRSLPAVLCVEQPAIKQGSGRLELARWIASPQNPLTSRVLVNRLWQHHFGAGLVRTVNNYGKLGTPPTHPALLDYLAAECVRSGWSIKAMHRLIMTSAAYQRTSVVTNERKDIIPTDPDNRWLARQNRRRLTAEELRDAMLAVTGELDRTLGGKAIRDLNTRRRTLYVTTIRSDRSNYQALFDAADPTAIIEQRTEATVAPQALWLLNHPFVVERSRTLATRVAKQPGDIAAKTGWLCEILFCRPATPDDVALARNAVADPAKPHDWVKLCQVLLCSNEFLYVD